MYKQINPESTVIFFKAMYATQIWQTSRENPNNAFKVDVQAQELHLYIVGYPILSEKGRSDMKNDFDVKVL